MLARPAYYPAAKLIPAFNTLLLFNNEISKVGWSMLSSMPFAIAQVDEVGFIFLAQMATSIIQICPWFLTTAVYNE